MNKYIVSFILSFFVGHAYAVVPMEKKTAGKMEDLSLSVPDGESFSDVRSIWLQKAGEKCDSKEFKIIRYSERNASNGDALSLNPAIGKYEAAKFPASVSGVFQCLKGS
ncbi:hypothetical protein [Microbulbifer donghaiensis]|uniref:hypothetical protein n=1 Tax=Microbulbifer donghaiensis TaxID=494016 RepID=UPI0011615155|nr:hypothetical protein [Microbulbifer donghaiensis]